MDKLQIKIRIKLRLRRDLMSGNGVVVERSRLTNCVIIILVWHHLPAVMFPK